MFVVLKFSKALYPKSVLLKASYSFTDRAYLHLDQDSDDYIVTITFKNDAKAFSVREFENEMLAQAVRYEVYKQTKEIRELIVARAMASTIIHEAPPPLEPVEEDVDVSAILKDWFESDE